MKVRHLTQGTQDPPNKLMFTVPSNGESPSLRNLTLLSLGQCSTVASMIREIYGRR